MAEKQAAPALVMVALLLFAAATPTAYGQAGQLSPAVGSILGLVNINGAVCCSSAGNCNGTTPGLPGVAVKVNCTNFLGASVLVGQGVTGVNGAFNISISKILNLLGITVNSLLSGKPLPCAAFVYLPLNQTVCPILNTATGILAGLPATVGNVLTPVLNTTVQSFVHLNVTLG